MRQWQCPLHLSTRSCYILKWASESDDHVRLVGFALSEGSDANRPVFGARTCVHIAAHRGSHRCLELLLRHAGNPMTRDSRLQTPLHLAATAFAEWDLAPDAHLRVVGLLLSSAADPTAEDDFGATPLHRALSHVDNGDTWRDLVCLPDVHDAVPAQERGQLLGDIRHNCPELSEQWGRRLLSLHRIANEEG